MSTDESRIVQHPEAVLRRVGTGAVLVHLGSGQVYELNDTAARAWELASEGRTASEIVSQLTMEYTGSSDTISHDVRALFSFLASHHLLSA